METKNAMAKTPWQISFVMDPWEKWAHFQTGWFNPALSAAK
jgi:hypothetical protein